MSEKSSKILTTNKKLVKKRTNEMVARKMAGEKSQLRFMVILRTLFGEGIIICIYKKIMIGLLLLDYSFTSSAWGNWVF